MNQPLPDAEAEPLRPSAVQSVRDVIDLWSSRKALADDLEAVGNGANEAVTVERVHKWAKRGVIPSNYHARILRAADRRGFALTAADIVAAHDAPTAIPSPTPNKDAA